MNGSWLDRNRNIVFMLLSVVAIVGGAIFYLRQPRQNPIEIRAPAATAAPTATETPAPPSTPTPAPVRVYITGAVVNSDVYFLPPGSIVKDAIQAAGGLTTEADTVQINQALELKDQQHIHIPRIGEENPPPPIQGGLDSPQPVGNEAGDVVGPATGGLINLNTATLEELDKLPGIGPAIAQRIIDYRENVGPFITIEEITQVSGIGEVTFSKIRDLITVE
jgi:competence protein ComEA